MVRADESGPKSMFNPDFDDVSTSLVSFKGAYAGQAAQISTVVDLSSDGDVVLWNKSPGTVNVSVSANGWFTLPADPEIASDEPEQVPDDAYQNDGTSNDGVYIAADNASDAMAKMNAMDAGQARAASVKFGPCTLYPTPIRIRTSGRVGTKPRTECTKLVDEIFHRTDMRYKSFIFWKLKGTKTGGNRAEKKYEQKTVEYKCVSTESTGWGSTTLGRVDYAGDTYYARVYPARAELKCGGDGEDVRTREQVGA